MTKEQVDTLLEMAKEIRKLIEQLDVSDRTEVVINANSCTILIMPERPKCECKLIS